MLCPKALRRFPARAARPSRKAENPVNEFWNRRPSIRPLTAAGAKAMEGFDGASADNPRLRCEPTSILFDWTFESDVNRIVQDDDRIVLRYGSMGLERTIHLNMNEHPADVAPSRAGHSIGRWEDDVLVVDTVGFEPGILRADGRLPHSNRLHVVERFSLEPRRPRADAELGGRGPVVLRRPVQGSDVVHISDVAYQPTPCEDLSYKSSDGGAGGADRV